jgi:hypothetical protein
MDMLALRSALPFRRARGNVFDGTESASLVSPSDRERSRVIVCKRLSALLLAMPACLLWLQACSNLPHRSDPVAGKQEASVSKDGVLDLFPTELAAGVTPVGWEKWILHPLKRKTDYGWKKDRQGVYLEAKSRSSASGLIKRLDLDPKNFPHLQFSWMIDGLLEGADVGDRAVADSPVRVLLAFDGDKSKLPIKEQAFIERVKTFTGQDIPYASLMYVWDNKRPLNSIVANPHTGRIQKLVASSGANGIRAWQTHQRNIIEDYRAAFGTEPGNLIGIVIMTDTDNTKTYAQSRYRGLTLSKNPASEGAAKTEQ